MFWSVIIPARNEEKALPDCIDSVKIGRDEALPRL